MGIVGIFKASLLSDLQCHIAVSGSCQILTISVELKHVALFRGFWPTSLRQQKSFKKIKILIFVIMINNKLKYET